MKKKKLLAGFVVVALGATGGGFFLFGRQGVVYPYLQLKQKSAEIAANRRLIDSLRQEIAKLTKDTAYIERIAREKLGMARPDEKIVKFIEKKKGP